MAKTRRRPTLGPVTQRSVEAPTSSDLLTPAARRETQVQQDISGAFSPTPTAHDSDEVTDAQVTVYDTYGEWEVRWVLASQHGGLVVRSLSIEPVGIHTPAGGVSANLLRALSPSGAVAAAAEHKADTRSFDALRQQWVRQNIDDHVPHLDTRQTVGRPRLSDEFLAELAIAYLDELPKGRGVHRRLAEKFDVELSTIRDRISIARDRGFLSKDATVGRAGAEPGPRLLNKAAENTEGQKP